MRTELTGEQIGRERMRFFERLKAAASAEWRVYTKHPSRAFSLGVVVRQPAREPQHLAANAKNRGIGPAFQMTTNADSEVGAKTIPCRWSNDESREFEYCT